MDAPDGDRPVHLYVECRECGMAPIVGPRYKCGNCMSYDLCERCEETTSHDPTHLFLKLNEPISYSPVIPVLEKNYYVDERKPRRTGQFNIPNVKSTLVLECPHCISVDLIPAAKEVLSFLEIIDGRTDLGDKSVLQRTKVKYLKYLHLVQSYPSDILHPPDDVEAYWESHIIRPEDYRLDCLEYFGAVLPHHIERMECMKAKGRDRVAHLWQITYGEDESEGGNVDTLQDHLKPALERLRCSEDDVIEDREWLGYFRHYIREVDNFNEFLESSLSGYKKFLSVCSAASKDPSRFSKVGMLEPSYAMDLLWHTHMLHPLEYFEDCSKMAGELIIHVPWPKDTTVNQMFDDMDKMNDLFKETFGESVHAALETHRG